MRSFGWFATFALVCAASVARAGEQSASSLDWVRKPGAEGCIDETELRARVEVRLSRKLVPVNEARLQVLGDIARSKTGFTARLETHDADKRSGSRTLTSEGEDCRRFDDALVLAITLMIDPDAPFTEPPAAVDVAPSAPTPPMRDPTADKPAPDANPDASPQRPAWNESDPGSAQVLNEPWRLGLSVQGAAAVGVLPGVALGGAVGATVIAPGGFGVEASGTLWAKTDSEPAQATLSLSQFSLRLCAVPFDDDAWMLSACGGGGVGLITAEGRRLDNPASDAGSFPFALGALGVSRALVRDLWLFGNTTLALPVRRARVSFRDENGDPETIYRAPAGNITWALGVIFFFSS